MEPSSITFRNLKCWFCDSQTKLVIPRELINWEYSDHDQSSVWSLCMPLYEILWWNTCKSSRQCHPLAMPQQPNSTKEEMPTRGRVSSLSTTASLFFYPSPSSWHGPLLETRNWSSPAWKFWQYMSWELVGTWKGNHSCWHLTCRDWPHQAVLEKGNYSCDTKKTTEKCLYASILVCRDWSHQAALGALSVLLGTQCPSPLPFPQPLEW